MPRLAFYTFGILKEAFGHPLMQGYLQAETGNRIAGRIVS
jgi:hypothetical protein